MTKYTAHLDGRLVGKRKSDRTYTHAIVVQGDEDYARDRAYNFRPSVTDRENFAYYTAIAVHGIQHEHARRHRPYGTQEWIDRDSASVIQDAVEHVEGGWEGYLARLTAHAIERFEAHKAAGGFEPQVVAWAGRPDLAQKRAAQIKGVGVKLVTIVPAEAA